MLLQLPLAGQHPRAGERHRAGLRDVARQRHPGGEPAAGAHRRRRRRRAAVPHRPGPAAAGTAARAVDQHRAAVHPQGPEEDAAATSAAAPASAACRGAASRPRSPSTRSTNPRSNRIHGRPLRSPDDEQEAARFMPPRGRRHALAHRRLRPDRRLPDRGAGGPRRLDRLALPAALRLRRLLRRAAGHAGPRPLAAWPRAARSAPCAAAIATARWSWKPNSRRPTARSTVDRLHAACGRDAPDLVRIVEGRRGRYADADGAGHPLRLRLDRPVGAAASTAACRPSPGRIGCVLRTAGRPARRRT